MIAIRRANAGITSIFLLVLSATAGADTRQVLDRVAGYGPSGARQMAFDVPPQERKQDSLPYAVTASPAGFIACQLTGRGGLACLDGRQVRYWPNAARSPEASETLFSCEDPVLGLDTKRGVQSCTGLAVDLSGAVWISGKKPNNSYSLIKAVPVVPEDRRDPPNVACAAGTTPLAGGKYCKVDVEFASGRPLLQEITPVDGDLASEFEASGKYGKGVLGVELRSSIVYFTDPKSAVKVIASGKSALGLSGNEQVLSAALLRSQSGAFVFVYVTSRGRVLGINDEENASVQLFDMLQDRGSAPPPAGCPATSDEDFAVATSSKSGRVYVSDRRYCRIVALEERPGTNPYGFVLANVTEPDVSTSDPDDRRELTLSTGALGPDSVSVAPGIVLNLAGCFGSCDFVNSDHGEEAATLRLVRLQETGRTNMTVFQITGIPDCRYIPHDDPRCAGKGAVVNPGDPLALQKLDVTKLLPREVTDLFAEGELPAMLVTERYRGQQKNGFVFDAFFGLPEAGVEFKDIFELEFAVSLLAPGVPWKDTDGCDDPMPGTTVPLGELLQWDVTTTVSEAFITTTDRYVGHVDTLVNSGCGSTKGAGSRWSIYAYNLELNPDTVTRVSDSLSYLNRDDDAVFARLLQGLYRDLYDTQSNFACAVPPELMARGVYTPPIDKRTCDSLTADWLNGLDKLDKCIGASTQPKQSSGDQNCTAFRSQLAGYQSTINAVPAAGPGLDVGNRIGELKARAKIVSYVFEYRFLPSIPLQGFCENPLDPACRMVELP